MFREMEKGPSGEVGFHAFRRWFLKALEDGRIQRPDLGGAGSSVDSEGKGGSTGGMGPSNGRELWGHAKTRLNALLMFYLRHA